MNLVIIQGAHTVDLMISLFGELVDASALATRQYPEIAVQGENRSVPRETFDHLLVQGRLNSGGALSAEIIGGRPKERTPFELVVFGDRGEVSLIGAAARLPVGPVALR